MDEISKEDTILKNPTENRDKKKTRKNVKGSSR